MKDGNKKNIIHRNKIEGRQKWNGSKHIKEEKKLKNSNNIIRASQSVRRWAISDVYEQSRVREHVRFVVSRFTILISKENYRNDNRRISNDILQCYSSASEKNQDFNLKKLFFFSILQW